MIQRRISKIDRDIIDKLLTLKRRTPKTDLGDKSLRAWCYSRVSTDEQVLHGFSLETQRERMEKYLEARGWVLAFHSEDAGWSGTKTSNRFGYLTGLNRMDEWDVLLVSSIDRVHRSSINYLAMMQVLEKRGKYLASIRESFDTSTAIGRFAMDLIQRVGQLEPELTGERTKAVMRGKAQAGQALGFYPPYGFNYVCRTCYPKTPRGPCTFIEAGSGRKDHDLVLVPVPEEVEWVKKIFRMYLDGRNMTAIALHLNVRDIKGKRGGKWNRKTISRMLVNPVYVGLLRWEDNIYLGGHKAVIPKRTFLRVLKKRAKRKRSKNDTKNDASRVPVK